jgi:hypothetical protein
MTIGESLSAGTMGIEEGRSGVVGVDGRRRRIEVGEVEEGD